MINSDTWRRAEALGGPLDGDFLAMASQRWFPKGRVGDVFLEKRQYKGCEGVYTLRCAVDGVSVFEWAPL